MISQKRGGTTLVELLVVLGIATLLAALILPAVKGLLTDRKGTQAATLVRNFLEAARSKAVGSGLPVAVIFERASSVPTDTNDDGLIDEKDLLPNDRLVSATAVDPLPANSPVDINFLPYNTCFRLSMAQQPLPVTTSMLGGTAPPIFTRPTGSWGGIFVPPNSMKGPALSVQEIQARSYFSVDVSATPLLKTFLVAGNEVSFRRSSTRYLIIESKVDTTNNILWFTTISSSGILSSLEQAIPANEVEVGIVPVALPEYTIFAKPRPVNGLAIQLPKGTCVDLSLSGFSSSGNVPDRDSRMRFSSAWVYGPDAAPNASELRPIYVVFTPDGGMSRVYANGLGSSLVPIETADDFFLHIGKIDQVVVPNTSNTVAQNMTDPSTFIVRLSPKSGAISVAPATLGLVSLSTPVGDVIELSRQGTYGAPITGQ